MKKFLFAALIGILGAMSAIAQTTDIHGRVTDQRNAGVTEAEVSVRSRSGARHVAVVESARSGEAARCRDRGPRTDHRRGGGEAHRAHADCPATKRPLQTREAEARPPYGDV